MIYLYTDGSCLNNQDRINTGGYAAILKYKNYIKCINGFEENTTNNRMELMAVIVGLRLVKNFDMPIFIFSDSAYIINCFEKKWYISWKEKNYLSSSNSKIKNVDLWKELLFLVERHKEIKFIKVKAHVKNESEIKKYYEKLVLDYGKCITFGEYKKAIEYNNLVDLLANGSISKNEIKTDDILII